MAVLAIRELAPDADAPERPFSARTGRTTAFGPAFPSLGREAGGVAISIKNPLYLKIWRK